MIYWNSIDKRYNKRYLKEFLDIMVYLEQFMDAYGGNEFSDCVDEEIDKLEFSNNVYY